MPLPARCEPWYIYRRELAYLVVAGILYYAPYPVRRRCRTNEGDPGMEAPAPEHPDVTAKTRPDDRPAAAPSQPMCTASASHRVVGFAASDARSRASLLPERRVTRHGRVVVGSPPPLAL